MAEAISGSSQKIFGYLKNLFTALSFVCFNMFFTVIPLFSACRIVARPAFSCNKGYATFVIVSRMSAAGKPCDFPRNRMTQYAIFVLLLPAARL